MLRVLVKALQLVLCFDFFTYLSFSFRFMSFFFNVSILLCFLVDSDRFASFRKDDIESSDAFFRD